MWTILIQAQTPAWFFGGAEREYWFMISLLIVRESLDVSIQETSINRGVFWMKNDIEYLGPYWYFGHGGAIQEVCKANCVIHWIRSAAHQLSGFGNARTWSLASPCVLEIRRTGQQHMHLLIVTWSRFLDQKRQLSTSIKLVSLAPFSMITVLCIPTFLHFRVGSGNSPLLFAGTTAILESFT